MSLISSCSLLRPSSFASSSKLLLPLLPTSSSLQLSYGFSTSSPQFKSRERRMRAKAKRDRQLQASEKRLSESKLPIDPVLGYSIQSSGKQSPWEGCRLQRILLRPEIIYSSPPPSYSSSSSSPSSSSSLNSGSSSPEHYLPGLTEEDKEMLFGALPNIGSELKTKREKPLYLSGIDDNVRGEIIKAKEDKLLGIVKGEEEKVEQMMRMLDLRNANKAGIEAVNRQRVIEEFGRKEEGKGLDTGSSEVQAALLTQKIRSMAEHLMSNPKDHSNRRSLRSLVHQRQQVLRYFHRKSTMEKYETLLKDLGLERRGVEGELTM